MQKSKDKISSLLKIFVVLLVGMLLSFFVFLSNKTVSKTIWPSYTLLGIGAVVTLIFCILFLPKMKKNALKGTDDSKWIMPLSFLILFLTQCFICINISFRCSWDSQAVQYCAMYAAYHDADGMKDMASYLSIYPSNLLLVWIYSLVYYWNSVFHITNDVLNLLEIMQCVISTLTAFLTYKCVKKLTNSEYWARVSFAIYVLVIGITGWLVIPYSDSTGLFLPMLLLYLILCYRESKGIMGAVIAFAIGYLAYFSYRIKPLIDIVVIAFALIPLVELIYSFKAKKLLQIIPFVVGFAISVVTVNMAIDSLGYELNPEAEFGWQHYIMQGVNTKSDGGNSDSDLAFSKTFETKAERDKVNLEVAKERLQEMGLSGYLRLVCIKMYRPFSSGTFGWDGVGYHEKYEPRLGGISIFLRRIFYEEKENEYGTSLYPAYEIIKQVIWMFCLIMTLVAALVKKELRFGEKVLFLTIIGIFPYFILLESHPRYMIALSPFIVIMTVLGLKSLSENMKK